MAYEATSLILEPPLPPTACGVEVMIVETRLAFPPSHEGEPGTVASLLAILVMFDPTDDARRSARAQAGHISAATISFEQMPAREDMGIWMSSLMADRSFSATCVVISLPDYSPAFVSRVASFISSMRISGTASEALIVMVAEVSNAWVECQFIVDGFVDAGESGRDVTALKVFDLMSALVAPGQAMALDADDLRAVLGSALQPSTLIDSAWFPQDGLFILGSDSVRKRLQTCSAVAVLPGSYRSIKNMHQLIQKVRLSCKAETNVVALNPYGNRIYPIPSHTVIPISLLTR